MAALVSLEHYIVIYVVGVDEWRAQSHNCGCSVDMKVLSE